MKIFPSGKITALDLNCRYCHCFHHHPCYPNHHHYYIIVTIIAVIIFSIIIIVIIVNNIIIEAVSWVKPLLYQMKCLAAFSLFVCSLNTGNVDFAFHPFQS